MATEENKLIFIMTNDDKIWEFHKNDRNNKNKCEILAVNLDYLDMASCHYV